MEADQIISRDTAVQIENAGIVFVWVYDMHDTGKKVKVIGNNFVDIGAYVEYDLSDTKVANKVLPCPDETPQRKRRSQRIGTQENSP